MTRPLFRRLVLVVLFLGKPFRYLLLVPVDVSSSAVGSVFRFCSSSKQNLCHFIGASSSVPTLAVKWATIGDAQRIAFFFLLQFFIFIVGVVVVSPFMSRRRGFASRAICAFLSLRFSCFFFLLALRFLFLPPLFHLWNWLQSRQLLCFATPAPPTTRCGSVFCVFVNVGVSLNRHVLGRNDRCSCSFDDGSSSLPRLGPARVCEERCGWERSREN